MSKYIIIEVKVYDSETKLVEQHVIDTYDSGHCYGYEIERHFESLGERFAKQLDPHSYED